MTGFRKADKKNAKTASSIFAIRMRPVTATLDAMDDADDRIRPYRSGGDLANTSVVIQTCGQL
jgi:hypothetical protein